MFSRVDFPDPEGPMMETNEPSSIVRSMPLRAWISCPLRGNTLVMPLSSIILADYLVS